MPIICSGCNKEATRNFVKCPKCSSSFHQKCVNFQSSKTLPASKIAEGWTCPDCAIRAKRGGDNSSTPLKPPTEYSGQYSDGESGKSSAAVSVGVGAELSKQTIDYLRNDIISAIKSELPALIRRGLKAELAPILAQIETVQHSVSFLSEKYDEIHPKIDKILADSHKFENELLGARDLTEKLSYRINALEQQLRESNIEVHGVPENRSEILAATIKQIGNVVSLKLEDEDIIKVTRVTKFNKESKAPRTIVAKLKSPRQRDEFISAITRYNKQHPTNRMNTGLIGIAGNSPVYISEHLSPQNKALHAAARIKAKEKRYKFVWVRSGRVFVRRDENSPFMHIKSLSSLDQMN
jgi:hypothetical protein